MRKINKACSIVGGLCVCMIAILTVTEAILRIFGHPTSWSSDITVYMLLVAIFLSSAYAFQEKGHIAVDFVQQAAGRVFGLKARKPMVIAGYLCAMFLSPF
jgi:TRAP-type C4-dicarboxylate transport system permease small subunit